MSNKYDIETFINDVISTLQLGLPAKIAAINFEKSDDFGIESISNDNYYDDITDQIININEFIYYTIVDIVTNSNGANTSLEVTLAVSVAFLNQNRKGTINRVLRYSRCLREVLQENFSKYPSTNKYKITEFIPVDIQTNQGSDFKMGGIHVTTTIIG